MNIIYNARFLNLPDTGIGRYFVNLLREIPPAAPENRYTLVTEKETDLQLHGLDSWFVHKVIPRREIFIHKDLKKTWWEQVQFRRFVHSSPDSIVHIPYGAPYYLKKNRIVLTVHDLAPLVFSTQQSGRAGVYDRYYLKLLVPALKNADCIIVDSEYTKKEIVRILGCPADKIIVVYLAAGEHFKCSDPEEARELVRTKYGLQKEYILYIGDASFRKNLPGLVDAYAGLPRNLRDKYDLVLCGTAKKSQTLRDRAARLEPDRIRFPGFIGIGDMPAVYSAASLFVFPTIYEGFGLPPLEAMSCGTPVVSSIYSSVPEVVGDAGLLIDTKSADALKDAITRVLTDETLHGELIEKGLERAKTFSWKKTARETLDVYKALGRN